MEEGLRRLAVPPKIVPAVRRIDGRGYPGARVVTGVRMGWLLAEVGFVPAYVFSLDTGYAATISALWPISRRGRCVSR